MPATVIEHLTTTSSSSTPAHQNEDEHEHAVGYSVFLGGGGVDAGAWLGGLPPVEGEGVAAAGASLLGVEVPPPSDLLPDA